MLQRNDQQKETSEKRLMNNKPQKRLQQTITLKMEKPLKVQDKHPLQHRTDIVQFLDLKIS